MYVLCTMLDRSILSTGLKMNCDILSSHCISDQNDGCEGPEISRRDGVQWSSASQGPGADSEFEPELRH